MCFTAFIFLGFTALHRAVFVNSVQIVNYLVSLGASVNVQVIINSDEFYFFIE